MMYLALEIARDAPESDFPVVLTKEVCIEIDAKEKEIVCIARERTFWMKEKTNKKIESLLSACNTKTE